MSVTSFTPSAGRPLPAAARLGLVGVVGLSLGVLTVYAQGWLPAELGSLANSAGSWAMVAYLLALLLATGARSGALIGSLALLALLVGYVLGANAQGYSSGTSLIAFWGAAALLAGPMAGVFGFWVRSGQGVRPAVGVGAMSGILLGEGMYGLTFIAETTYAPYWWGQTIVGVLLATWVVMRGPDYLQMAVVALTVCALTAIAFVLVYSNDVLAGLP